MADSTPLPTTRDFTVVDFVDDYPVAGDELAEALAGAANPDAPPPLHLPPRWPPEEAE